MRSGGWRGLTTWQRSSGRRPPSTRPGLTVGPCQLLPFPPLLSPRWTHTHTQPLLPPSLPRVCLSGPLPCHLETCVSEVPFGFIQPQAVRSTLGPGPPRLLWPQLTCRGGPSWVIGGRSSRNAAQASDPVHSEDSAPLARVGCRRALPSLATWVHPGCHPSPTPKSPCWGILDAEHGSWLRCPTCSCRSPFGEALPGALPHLCPVPSLPRGGGPRKASLPEGQR